MKEIMTNQSVHEMTDSLKIKTGNLHRGLERFEIRTE